MPYSGAFPRLVSPQDIGLHVVSHSPVILDHYRNGVAVERLTHPDDYTGTNVVLAMFSHAGVDNTCRWDRIEYRSAPGGTLLGSDDFASLTGWSPGVNGGAFSADSGYAKKTGPVSEAGIYQSIPSGTTFIETQGLSIEGDPRTTGDQNQSSWLGFMGWRGSPAGGSVFSPPYGWLLIMRNNGVSELNQGTPYAAGWTVGMVAFA